MSPYVAMAGPAVSVLLPHLPCARNEYICVILPGSLLNVFEGMKRGYTCLTALCFLVLEAFKNANKDVSIYDRC